MVLGMFPHYDKHRFPDWPVPPNTIDLLHTKASRLEALTHRPFREEPDVARARSKMLLKGECDNAQILDPTMVWSGQQKETVLCEEAVNLTNESHNIEEMFDDFCTEADIE
jgi:hypothetical protein